MTERKQVKNIDSEAIKNIRVGYQVAVNLWTYQGTLNWNRYNIMLIANSVIISAISIIISSSGSSAAYAKWLLCAGLIFCVLWIFITGRGFAYRDHWSSNARELETYFQNLVTTVSGAKAIRKGGVIKFNFLSCVSERFPAYFVIVIFIALYIIAYFHLKIS